jgi:hypothetical protein
MRSTPLLLEATPLDCYVVHVRFEDGTEADVDLGYLADLDGVFEPLRNPEYFRQLRVYPEGQTIVWPSEADIAPRLCTPTPSAGRLALSSLGKTRHR